MNLKTKTEGVNKTDFGIVIGLSIVAYFALLTLVIYLNVEATQWIRSLFG